MAVFRMGPGLYPLGRFLRTAMLASGEMRVRPDLPPLFLAIIT